jgi:hypothetical protein
MGFTFAWVAIARGQKADLLDRLNLEVIGDTDDETSERFAFAETSAGWSVLVMNDPPRDMHGFIRSLSPDGLSMSGLVVENVTYSELVGYQDGRVSWSVAYDPDKGKGEVVVQGAPPEPCERLRLKLAAEEAACDDKDVSYMFDLPLKLTEALSGYHPTGNDLTWQALGEKGAVRARPRPIVGGSMTEIMKAELLPVLWSLGWKSANDALYLHLKGQIVREIEARKETLWFGYGSGFESYISVHFMREEPTPSGTNRIVCGRGGYAPVRMPWWKRLSWSHFWAITQAPPPPEDPVAAAIEQAKAEILAIDDYLKTGQANPLVQVEVMERRAEN